MNARAILRQLPALLVCFAVVATVWIVLTPQPGLIGHGCDGAAGPLYAFDESDFPPCLEIVSR